MITDLEEETLDLDWFSIDDNGEIAHFASGGQGFLPLSVKASKSTLTRLAAFFRQSLSANGVSIESATISSHVQFKSEAQKARYMEDYSRMGAKGLYSFDCIIGPNRPSNYYMVVTPSRPLKVDELPNDIRQILNMTRYAGKFCSLGIVKDGEIA